MTQIASAISGCGGLRAKTADRPFGKEHAQAGQTDPSRTLRLACRANLTEVRGTLQHIHDFLTVQDLPCETVDDLDLVLSEAMSNIVRHGAMGGDGRIDCHLVIRDTSVECRLSDTGVAFDPSGAGLTAPDPMAFSEGGYGWFLIRSLTHHITYARDGACNVLCFSILRCAGCGSEWCRAACQ